MSKQTVRFYVTLEPGWRYGRLQSVKATNLRQSKPTAGGVHAGFELTLPENAFEPFRIVEELDERDLSIIVEEIHDDAKSDD